MREPLGVTYRWTPHIAVSVLLTLSAPATDSGPIGIGAVLRHYTHMGLHMLG